MGVAYLEAERLEDAITAFTDAAQLAPDWPLAHFNLGAAYRKKGDFEKAMHALDNAARLNPKNPDISAARAHLFLESSLAGFAFSGQTPHPGEFTGDFSSIALPDLLSFLHKERTGTLEFSEGDQVLASVYLKEGCVLSINGSPHGAAGLSNVCERLVKLGAVTVDDLEVAMGTNRRAEGEPEALAKELVEDGIVAESAVKAAILAEAQALLEVLQTRPSIGFRFRQEEKPHAFAELAVGVDALSLLAAEGQEMNA